MKKNRKLLIGIGIVALLGIVSVGVYNWQQRRDVKRIGLLSILTGQFSKIGTDVLNGVMLYIDEYNLKHPDSKISLDVEDGKAEAKFAATGFAKLTNNDIVGCIVVGDNQAYPTARMAVKKHVPTIVCSTGTSAFLVENGINSPWIIKYSSAVSQEASELAVYAKMHLKLEYIALLTMEGGFGEDSGQAFESSFTRVGGKIVAREVFAIDATDIRPQIDKICDKKPQAVYISGYGASYFRTINQYREKDVKNSILTTDCISTPVAKASIKDFRNIYYSGFVLPQSKRFYDFEASYMARYNEKPTRDSLYGYDSVALICSAINAGIPKDKIAQFIMSANNHNLLAGDVKFLSNGDVTFPIKIIKVNANE